MTKRIVLFILIAVLVPFSAHAQSRVPTVDDLLNVKSLGGPRISPDGKWIAYTVNEADWKQDAFVTHIWLLNTAGGKAFQLTRGEKSAGVAQWSPDGEILTFASTRVGDKNQIFAIRVGGGEAVQLTKAENGVNGYQWSRDGKSIAYTTSDLDSKAAKERSDYLGGFEVTRKEYTFAQLWTLEVEKALAEPVTGTQRTKSKDFTIGAFEWSPDGSQIAFAASVNSDLINGGTSDIYSLTLANNTVKKLVSQLGPDNDPHWSPWRFTVSTPPSPARNHSAGSFWRSDEAVYVRSPHVSKGSSRI